jgi:hypothetical protein
MSEVTAVPTKNKIIETFRDFLRRYETVDRKYRRHRTDGGGKFMAGYFQEFRKKKGIIWEPTTADQHQQNGASERLNRITMNKLYPLIISSELLEKYWPEVLLTVNYLRNRSSSSVIGKIFYEAWY